MGLEARISRLEQRLGQPAEQDLVIFVIYDTPGAGATPPDSAPAYTVRYTATGERITTYYDPVAGVGPDIGPGTKCYRGFDPDQV